MPFWKKVRVRLLLSVWLIATPVAAAGGAQTRPTELRVLRLVREGPFAVLTIEARGPLPIPGVGQVEGPIRIFLDFPGTLAKAAGIPDANDPVVQRVRIAQHSANPLVTRVVLDLKRNEPFQIDTDQLATGRLLVTLGTGESEPPPVPLAPPASKPAAHPPRAAVPPAPRPIPEAQPQPSAAVRRPDAIPPVIDPFMANDPSRESTRPAPPGAAPAPTGSTGSPPPGIPPIPGIPPAPPTGASTADINRYKELVLDALGQVLALRPLLGSIDRFTSPPPPELQSAAEEFDRIRRVVSGVQPPESLRRTHDLLVRACALGSMAVRLRVEANRTSDIGHVRNAGSAAAGAVMLLDRVCADVSCEPQLLDHTPAPADDPNCGGLPERHRRDP